MARAIRQPRRRGTSAGERRRDARLRRRGRLGADEVAAPAVAVLRSGDATPLSDEAAAWSAGGRPPTWDGLSADCSSAGAIGAGGSGGGGSVGAGGSLESVRRLEARRRLAAGRSSS